MRMLHRLTLARAGAPESNTWIGPVGIGRRHCEWQDLGQHRTPRAEGAPGRRSKTAGLMRHMGGGLLFAVLAASGQWRAAAVVVPPAGTNRMGLTWSSLGSGTRYYVQTSTNLLTWTAATNTTATNVTLTFIGGQQRMFRLSVSNAPPPSVTLTLAWDPSPGTNVIANYKVYYGVASATYTNAVATGANTTVSISNLVAGRTYWFAATAIDTSGLESDYSAEVSALTPVGSGIIPPQLKIKRLP